MGEADLGCAPDVDGSDWREYMKHLPTREDFKILMVDMKETFRSEMAALRHDVKAVAV